MDLVELARFGTDQEAHATAAFLKAQGLHPTVVNDGMANVLGVGYHIMPARILIPEPEKAEAQILLIAIDEEMKQGAKAGEPETCPKCGEDWEPGFDACWSCSEPL